MQEKDLKKKNQFEQRTELEMQEKDFKEKRTEKQDLLTLCKSLGVNGAMHCYCLPLPVILSYIFLAGNSCAIFRAQSAVDVISG